MSVNQWQNGLFSCDVGKCLFAFCCMPCAVASARTAYDESNWLLNFCCLTPVGLRNIVREGYNIEGTWVNDCLLGSFCSLCSTVQVGLEIESRPGPGSRFGGGSRWSSSLTDCFSDIQGTLMAWCLPACALAMARTKYDGSNCFFNFCCMGGVVTANIIREGYQVDGTALGDCLLLSCPFVQCMYIAQITREVNARGNPASKTLA